MEEGRQDKAIDQDRLKKRIEKSFLTQSGKKKAEEALLSSF